MNRTAGDRLKRLREAKGFETAKDAADAFGWNEVTYRSHENGTRNIPYGAAQRYALAYGVKPQMILAGENGEATVEVVNHVIKVPLVGTVSAGVFREGNALEDMEILVPAVPRPDIPASAQYCLKVEGPSVNLRIADGAFAICARYDRYPGGPQHGQLVHVVRERSGLVEHTIKELRYSRKGSFLMPCSDDPRYQEPVMLDSSDSDEVVRIEGVVIGKFEPM